MCDQFTNLDNYSGLFAVFSAIESDIIAELTDVWQNLTKEYYLRWNKIRRDLRHDNNYYNLRQMMKRRQNEMVPYIQLYLNELVKIDTIDTGIISGFNKIEETYRIVQIINLMARRPPYFKLKPNWKVQKLILSEFETIRKSPNLSKNPRHSRKTSKNSKLPKLSKNASSNKKNTNTNNRSLKHSKNMKSTIASHQSHTPTEGVINKNKGGRQMDLTLTRPKSKTLPKLETTNLKPDSATVHKKDGSESPAIFGRLRNRIHSPRLKKMFSFEGGSTANSGNVSSSEASEIKINDVDNAKNNKTSEVVLFEQTWKALFVNMFDISGSNDNDESIRELIVLNKAYHFVNLLIENCDGSMYKLNLHNPNLNECFLTREDGKGYEFLSMLGYKRDFSEIGNYLILTNISALNDFSSKNETSIDNIRLSCKNSLKQMIMYIDPNFADEVYCVCFLFVVALFFFCFVLRCFFVIFSVAVGSG